VGSVEEISGQTATRSEVRLRVLSNSEGLAGWLGARRDIGELAQRNGHFVLTHDGGPEEQAKLLREVVEAGFAVVEFASKTKSLEDVFLHVTEGRVQ
jgi:ABC-2 type transport system ATP-binding protein